MSRIDPFSITKALDQAIDASERPFLLVLMNSNVRHSKQSTRPLIPFTTSITRHMSGLFGMLLPFSWDYDFLQQVSQGALMF